MRQDSSKSEHDPTEMATEDGAELSSSEGSAFSPDADTEDKIVTTRSLRAQSASKRGEASQTATSRRDDTDTYHRYVSAQMRKGRDLNEVHDEGRVKANEKRVKNRDYARNKLATGKARVAQLEGQVEQLVRSNESLANEISQLEAEITAKDDVARDVGGS